MKPGDKVLLTRGGPGVKFGLRTVQCTLIAIEGSDAIVRMEQDDSQAYTGYCSKRDAVGF